MVLHFFFSISIHAANVLFDLVVLVYYLKIDNTCS